MKQNLRKFRYIRKNIASARMIRSGTFIFETRFYRVKLTDGNSVVVKVDNIHCYGGGLFASINRDSDAEEVLNHWTWHSPFFRLQSRLLAEKLYYNYQYRNKKARCGVNYFAFLFSSQRPITKYKLHLIKIFILSVYMFYYLNNMSYV